MYICMYVCTVYVCRFYVFYASKSDRLVIFLGVCAARVASRARAVVAIHARILRRNKRLKVSPRLGFALAFADTRF